MGKAMLSDLIKNFDRKKIKIEEYYYSGEEGFYKAYLNHLKISESLFDLGHEEFYSIVLLLLYMSIECFLKDLFCIARTEILKRNAKTLNVINPSYGKFYSNNLMDEALKKSELPKNRFSHDLILLADFVSDHFGCKGNVYYTQFSSALPGKDWINDRYKDPKKSERRNNKKEYHKLKTAFENIRKEIFGRFK